MSEECYFSDTLLFELPENLLLPVEVKVFKDGEWRRFEFSFEPFEESDIKETYRYSCLLSNYQLGYSRIPPLEMAAEKLRLKLERVLNGKCRIVEMPSWKVKAAIPKEEE